jgi:type IV secretory pathway TraG/TraD family ATPase VirD4
MLAAVPDTAPAFSFDRFYSSLAEHNGPKPFIFLAAPRRYREAAAPVIAAWIDAAASAILQRPIDDAPNAWLFIDELPSLPPIASLLTLLPEGRKHRACIVLAFQSIAQMRQTYGSEGAEIVTGQTATQLIMAAGDHASAKWATELMGTIEVESQRPSDQLSEDRKTHGSLATTRERKALVLDAEVTGLRIGEAFLRLSSYPIARITIDPPAARPAIAPAFVPAPMPPRIAPDPATPPQIRIEDREDWLSREGPF